MERRFYSYEAGNGYGLFELHRHRLEERKDALKKEGLILSYKVLTTEAHGAGDFNIMLMTEYKNLASMEANEDKADNLAQQVTGNDEKQRQGYKDRLEIREVLQDRLAREIVLEPKR